jgi:16S rRNA (cytidine1402-2'-O)-methyltransferase
VEVVRARGGTVIPIPGPSAITAALSAAGLPTDKFVFLGFLPKKSAAAEKMLKEYGDLDATLVIYESPFRVRKLLESIRSSLGDRVVSVCRELTKVHEEIITGAVSDVIERKFVEKGEFVVLVAKKDYK